VKQAVLNFSEVVPNSIVASNRIATYIADKLKCDLIDRKSAIRSLNYDRIWIVNGVPVFCGFIEEAKYLIQKCPQLVWVGNDYAIPVWSPVRKKDYIIVSAYEKSPRSKINKPFLMVNWNQLTYTPVANDPWRISGLSYYGAYREDREFYFQKYFATDKYPVWVNPSKDAEPFRAINPHIKTWSCSNLISSLGSFQSTLYIEDQRSHDLYCSPANRFYEALSAGTLVLFDKSCINTFRRAGIPIARYLVDGPDSYAEKLARHDELRELQRQELVRDYRAQLDFEFAEAAVQVERYFTRPAQPDTILRRPPSA
jgi:hypothetical protein